MMTIVQYWSVCLRWLILGCAFVLACLLLFTPGGTVPSGPAGADTMAHCVIFAMLALCSRFARISEKYTLAWVLLFAAASEVIQALWIPRRDGSLLDLLTDAIGLCTVLLLWWWKIRPGARWARTPRNEIGQP